MGRNFYFEIQSGAAANTNRMFGIALSQVYLKFIINFLSMTSEGNVIIKIKLKYILQFFGKLHWQ